MLYVRNVHLTIGQAYSDETIPSSSQRGCYIRIMIIRVQLKESVVVILKGFRLGSGGISIVGSLYHETPSEDYNKLSYGFVQCSHEL
jgi:hypothetical protein